MVERSSTQFLLSDERLQKFISSDVFCLGEWTSKSLGLPQPGEAKVVHDVDPNASPGNRGAANGVSGPILASMLLESGVLALRTKLLQGERVAAVVDLNISYLRPAFGKMISAHAKATGRSGANVFAEAVITNDEGKMVATGRIVCQVDNECTHEDAWPQSPNMEGTITNIDHARCSLELCNFSRGHVVYKHCIAGWYPNDSVIPALVDMSAVAAVLSILKAGERYQGTIELNASFLRKVPAACKLMTVSADVIQKGRNIAFSNCSIKDDAGHLVALGRIVYSVGQQSNI